MQLFYAYQILENTAFLDAEESRHCTKTLRKSEGDVITIIDGRGGFYRAVIKKISKKSCELDLQEELFLGNKRDYYLHIAIAPTKNINRLEWFLEKTTEIGIDEITPILCQRSERKVVKNERLEKIILSAAKQSLKAKLPKLNTLTKFKDLVQENKQAFKAIAHCNSLGENPLLPLKIAVSKQKDILILIGPEGDFSLEEVVLAKENGFEEISLGTSRLRTETAGIVACHTVGLMR